MAHRLSRGRARGDCGADAQDAPRARHRMGGAGHAPERKIGASDVQKAQGVSRGGPSAYRPEARAAAGRRPARIVEEHYGSGDAILRHRTAQDFRRSCLASARRRADRREPSAFRGILRARDAQDDDLSAAPAHEHHGTVRCADQRGRRRPLGTGRRGSAWYRPSAPAIRRQAAAAVEAGWVPYTRSAHEGTQEVRSARCTVQVPVLEAVNTMLKVAVAGASGYMGAELLRLLSVHPKVHVTAVTSERLAGERLDRVYPHLRGLSDLTFRELDGEKLAEAADLVFLALPHMESQRAMPILRRLGRKAIDLSADYRLSDPSLYATWYKGAHEDPDGLKEAVYGLPELHRKAITGASLVASPGCYPMGAVLAIAPLLKSGWGLTEGIVIDGKSGVTGAGAQGRKIDPMYLYTEANENVQAYGIASHRHTPEIEQELSGLAGRSVIVTFTPHLVPLNRGLFTTASVPLDRPRKTDELVALYREFYAGEPFVRVLDEGQRPMTRAVVGSNFCDVTVVADQRTGRAVCLSALDNLGKGGSANGVQNLNLILGWDERAGLEAPPVYP